MFHFDSSTAVNSWYIVSLFLIELLWAWHCSAQLVFLYFICIITNKGLLKLRFLALACSYIVELDNV